MLAHLFIRNYNLILPVWARFMLFPSIFREVCWVTDHMVSIENFGRSRLSGSFPVRFQYGAEMVVVDPWQAWIQIMHLSWLFLIFSSFCYHWIFWPNFRVSGTSSGIGSVLIGRETTSSFHCVCCFRDWHFPHSYSISAGNYWVNLSNGTECSIGGRQMIFSCTSPLWPGQVITWRFCSSIWAKI